MNPEKRRWRAPRTRRTWTPGSIAPGLWGLLAVFVTLPPLGAQELRRELPPGPCVAQVSAAPASATPSPADRQEAERLASEANQAAILGDLQGATGLLREAAELDPLSSTVAYRLARILEDAGEAEAALGEFCRYLALEPDAPDAAETTRRAERLAFPDRTPLSAAARSAFEEGVSAYDQGAYDEAAQYFSRAVVERPDWEDAYYNRGVSYLRAGRNSAAAADLERYLEGSPDAADREAVQEYLDQISAARPPQYSPGVALTTGLLIPGMGQFYTGNPRRGLLFLASAGTAAAVGILYRKVEVDCLQVPVDGVCPPDQIVDERVERPLLVPGLVAAVSITVVGAILAYRDARDSDPRLTSDEEGLQYALPDFASGAVKPSLRLEPVAGWGGGGARLLFELRF